MFFRRFPLPVRPIPFCFGAALVILGIARGFAWEWMMVPEQGTLRLMIVFHSPFIAFDAVHTFWLVLLVLGAIALAWSFVESDPDATGPMASTWTFYPFVFLLGVLLSIYGAIYLFDVTNFADDTPGGFVALLYFDYAGLTQRLVKGLIGLALTITGLVFLIGWSLDRSRQVPATIIAPPTIHVELAEPAPLEQPSPAATPPQAVARLRPRPAESLRRSATRNESAAPRRRAATSESDQAAVR